MGIKQNQAYLVFTLFNTIFLIFLSVITVYPLLHVFFASVSNAYYVVQHQGIMLYPIGFHFAAYKMVFQNPMIAKGYKNTLIYMTLGTIINIILTSLTAYVLSRKNLMLKNQLMLFAVFTMFFSGGIIPNYLIVRNLGMINKIWALVLPTAMSTFNMIIMRTAFMAIPDSLEESARIDGANDFIILFRIILPLSKAVLSVIILFYAVSHWNAWFHASIYLRNREMYPLQVILREILLANNTDTMLTGVHSADKGPVGEIVKYAAIIVATLPILLLYPFLQRFFEKGVVIGSVKG